NIAVAPMAPCQPPADLDAAVRHVGLLLRRAREAAEAHGCIRPAIGEREEAEAGLRDDAADALEGFVRLGARAQEGEELHDHGIGIDLVEEVPVFVFPVAKNEAL